MYEKFDVHFGYVEYRERTGSKERPVVIFGANSENANIVYVYGIYSYRKWFANSENTQKLYEIKDIEHAGLDRRSFVNVSRDVKVNAEVFRTYKYFGKLSERDIEGLLAKVNAYDELQSYRAVLAEFLKTFDN
jgi:hypothetical protein